jgi:hypothetical protein
MMPRYHPFYPPPSSQRLWHVWYTLELLERRRCWPVLIGTRAPACLDSPASSYDRLLAWWFWDGVGAWLVGHTERAEQRWLRVRYAATRRRRRLSDRCS